MSLTLSSVLTTSLLGTALILIVCPLLKRNKVLEKVGPNCVKILLLALALRMLFPFEMRITHSIHIQKVLPFIYDALKYEIQLGTLRCSIYQIVMAVWVLGVLYSLGKKAIIYKGLIRYIQLLPFKGVAEIYNESNIEEQYPEIAQIRVVYIKEIKTPFLLGMYPAYILLPEGVYTSEQLGFIIKHELMHHRKRDVLWKCVIDILCSVFWWNPAMIYLKKSVFQIVEISNDIDITTYMTEKEKISYMECLRDIAVNEKVKDRTFTVPFCKSNFKDLRQRLNLIDDGVTLCPQIVSFVSMFVILLILGISMVIFEPYSPPEEGTPLTSENTYLIMQGQIFDVYVEGEYLFTTDDLEPFQGIKIYDNIQEAKRNDKD